MISACDLVLLQGTPERIASLPEVSKPAAVLQALNREHHLQGSPHPQHAAAEPNLAANALHSGPHVTQWTTPLLGTNDSVYGFGGRGGEHGMPAAAQQPLRMCAPSVTTGEFARPDPLTAAPAKLPGGRRPNSTISFRPGYTVTTSVEPARNGQSGSAMAPSLLSPRSPRSVMVTAAPMSPRDNPMIVPAAHAAVSPVAGCGSAPLSPSLMHNPYAQRMAPKQEPCSYDAGSDGRLARHSNESERSSFPGLDTSAAKMTVSRTASLQVQFRAFNPRLRSVRV